MKKNHLICQGLKFLSGQELHCHIFFSFVPIHSQYEGFWHYLRMSCFCPFLSGLISVPSFLVTPVFLHDKVQRKTLKFI